MKELLEMLKKKAQESPPLSEHEAKARMSVLDELKQLMHDAMAKDLGPGHMAAKVEANNPQDLKAGLMKAQNMADQIPAITEQSKHDADQLQGEEADHNLEPDVNEEKNQKMASDADLMDIEKFQDEEDKEPLDDERNEDAALDAEAEEPEHKKSLKNYRY